MKLYEVELRYVSYVTITIEADSAEQAEQVAWDEINTDGSYRSDCGDWSIESVEDVTTQGESK